MYKCKLKQIHRLAKNDLKPSFIEMDTYLVHFGIMWNIKNTLNFNRIAKMYSANENNVSN